MLQTPSEFVPLMAAQAHAELLVRLYALPPRPPTELADGTSIRRALGPDS